MSGTFTELLLIVRRSVGHSRPPSTLKNKKTSAFVPLSTVFSSNEKERGAAVHSQLQHLPFWDESGCDDNGVKRLVSPPTCEAPAGRPQTSFTVGRLSGLRAQFQHCKLHHSLSFLSR